MNKFEQLNLSESLMKAINRFGFTEPTQIQRETIPLILQGKDVIGESATGSGKTLAFGAGIIEKCEPKRGVQAIVLVPTRELAEQVKDEIIQISFDKPLRILAVYGGVSINPQIDQLRRSEVVVATPGRMLDHLNRRTINTSKVKIFVLDEADRMVEMGFIEDVEKIIRACPKDKQTLLFSATMYGPAKKIAKNYMKHPVTVHATKMVDPSKLKQSYYNVPPRLKKELLAHLLKKEKSDLVMVFCNTRRATEMVAKSLKSEGIKSTPIHGGLTQVKRLKTIELFHKGRFQVLVCTDVAARGLHIEGVTHIYNFDIPKTPSEYVHRIGRTARAGKTGIVINILANRDHDNFSRLQHEHRDFNITKEERPFLKENPHNKDEFQNRSGGFKGKKTFRRGGPSRRSDDSRGPPRRSNFGGGSPRRSDDSRGPPRRSNFGDGPSRRSDDSPRRSDDSRGPPRRSNFGGGSPRRSDDSPRRSDDSRGPPRRSNSGDGPSRRSDDSRGPPRRSNFGDGSPRRSDDSPRRSDDSRGPPRRSNSGGGSFRRNESSDGKKGFKPKRSFKRKSNFSGRK